MKKLLKQYIKNINYFKEHHTTLHNQIIDIEEGLKTHQRYHLESVNKSLNIYDMQTQTLLIQKESKFDASFKAHQIDNTTKQSIKLIQTQPIDFEKSFDYGIDSYDFIDKYIKKIKFNNIKLKEYKFIFCGVVLGLDINEIIKNSKATSCIFIEEDIELFRLSLFIVPYFKISKKTKPFFAIGENYLNTFDKFISNNSKLNHFIKYSIANDSYKNICTKLILQIELNNPLMYTFSEYLGSYKRGLEYINSFAKLIQFKSNLKSKHILYLGAGPSLEKEIKFIKKNKNKFIIIALGATLKLLEQHKIKPDIIISIDGSSKIVNQFNHLNKEFFKDIPIILSLNTNKKVLKHINKKDCYFIQTSTVFYENQPNFTGNSAGEIGLGIILELNPLDIYLLGFDLSIDKNKTHISTHKSTISKSELDMAIKYKGNIQDSVFTINRFLQIKRNFEEVLQTTNIDIFNLSDGIHIEYTKSFKITNINLSQCAKDIQLQSSSLQPIKKDIEFLNKILELYKELLSPYSELLISQEKYDKIKPKQIKQIKRYYDHIE